MAKAVAGLTYPSESDEPFDVVCWENPEGRTVADVLAARIGTRRKIRVVPVEEFFGQLEASEDAPRYRALRRTIETLLKDVAAFRVGEGEVRVDVYVIGRMGEKWVAGVHSVSVET